MINLRFTVKPDDADAYDVVADSRDFLAWEAAGSGRRKLGAFANAGSVGISELYGIAFQASVRQGKFAGSYEDFARTCQIDPEPDATPVDPTPPAA